MKHVVDPDGNIIAEEMLVRFDGESFVVGYAHPTLVRLDSLKGRHSVILGRRNFRYIHVIGFRYCRKY